MMWDKQKPDGIIEGWHGDGNFARTSLMYALWKTQGLHLDPWRADVKLGAALDNGRLYIVVQAESPWRGKLIFDRPRHRTQMHMPVDYPRINQFPEWFTVEEQKRYLVKNVEAKKEQISNSNQLARGLAIELAGATELHLIVTAASPN
jgi:hypothetical protein